MKNKKLFIILGIILGVIVLFVVTYLILLSPVGRSNKEVTFVVEKGDGKEKIINNLKDAKLIRSKYATILYVILSGSKNLQAGSYNFSRDMSTNDIIKSLKTGDVIKKYKDSSRITLKEGDIVSVTVKNTNKTISQMLRNFFYMVSGNESYQISAQQAGVVAVNGSTNN